MFRKWHVYMGPFVETQAQGTVPLFLIIPSYTANQNLSCGSYMANHGTLYCPPSLSLAPFTSHVATI